MSEQDSPGEHDNARSDARIERAVKLAGAFGFNEVKLRWKLLRWRDQRRARAQATVDGIRHAGYEHAVCAECGRIQPRGGRECTGCGAPMTSRAAQVMRRAGFISPLELSASMALGVLILLCYARQVAFSDGAFASFDGRALVALGAHYPPIETATGQWWRLGTAVFLHGGIMHVAFNMLALMQIGPAIEDIFGRGRMMFLFVATGILANVPSLLMGRDVPSIGASGAIMGLIGVAAGWGHRDGTTIGRSVRDQMLKWLLYTTIFGLMVNADHAAHISGFLAGAALGLVSMPAAKGRPSRLDSVLGTVGFLIALALTALVFIAPAREMFR